MIDLTDLAVQSTSRVSSVSQPVNWSVSHPVSLVSLGSLASLDRQDSLVSRVSLDSLVSLVSLVSLDSLASQDRQSVSQSTSQFRSVS